MEQAYGGSNGDFTASFGTSVRGSSPSTLMSVTLPATLSSSASSTGDGDNAAVNSSSLWYTITELETGEPYFVRVSASNARGLGLPRGSNPAYLAPPKQVPANPEGVHIFPATSNSLRCAQSNTHQEPIEAVCAEVGYVHIRNLKVDTPDVPAQSSQNIQESSEELITTLFTAAPAKSVHFSRASFGRRAWVSLTLVDIISLQRNTEYSLRCFAMFDVGDLVVHHRSPLRVAEASAGPPQG